MFLHVSVILFTGGGVVSAPLNAGIHQVKQASDQTPPEQTPPYILQDQVPPEQTPQDQALDLFSCYPVTPAQCMLGDTGNKQAVHILLECNLVTHPFCYVFVHRWGRTARYFNHAVKYSSKYNDISFNIFCIAILSRGWLNVMSNQLKF